MSYITILFDIEDLRDEDRAQVLFGVLQLSSDRLMQCGQPKIFNVVRLTSLVVVAFAFLIFSGCAQEEQIEKGSVTPPNVSVDFNGPGNRVDESFQGLSPE